ncbi:MAG TPA: family 78 glycoside hydrolase catalytic domain, partial [Thermoguttaceae bacterium]|nr:family 78 glycoside hydrolase catalytic domain [Thermoguttaceae bacterium]
MKHRAKLVMFLIMLASCIACDRRAGAAPQAGHLTCEYRVDPIGIDTIVPRLGWWVESAARGEMQTAYQVLVASSPEKLGSEEGDLWDTGRVASGQNVHVVYRGKTLQPGQRCWWKVRIWGRDPTASDWSDTSTWQIALLRDADWSARWVGPEPTDKPNQGSTLLRKRFTLPKAVKHATASVCGLGWFELHVNRTKAGNHVLAPPNSRYGRRVLFDTLDITDSLQTGENAVGVFLGNGYDSEYSRWGWKFADSRRAIVQIDVEYQDGTRDRIVSDDTWSMAAGPITFCGIYSGETCDAREKAPGWATAAFDDSHWQPVALVPGPGGVLQANTMPPIRVVETIRPVAVTEPRSGVFVFDMGQNFAGWTRLRVNGNSGTTVTLRHSELVGEDGNIDPWTNRNAKATD